MDCCLYINVYLKTIMQLWLFSVYKCRTFS